MKKVLAIACLTLLFVGCANKIEVKCPSCNISSVEGNQSFECTECTIEATGQEDFSFISLPSRD